MEAAFSLLSSPSHPQQGDWFCSSLVHYSWSSRFSCKTRQTCKSSMERWARNETHSTEFGFVFAKEKREAHLCWCKTVQLLPSHSHEEQSIQAAFLVREGAFHGVLLVSGAKGTLEVRQQMGLGCSQGEVRCRMMEIPFYPSGLEFPWPLLGQRDGGGPWQKHHSRSV